MMASALRPRWAWRAVLTCLVAVGPGGAQAIDPIRADSTGGAEVLLGALRMPAGSVGPTTLAGRCAAGEAADPTVAEVRGILAHPSAAGARDRLEQLDDSLTAVAIHRPDDVSVNYALAVVLGARSETSGGGDKLSFADSMRARAQAVLELEPGHPGARHLLGRVHAAVRRLGGLKRLLARTLFGGEVLSAASWESARAHLEAAERGAPCVPDHHYELARLYADRGDSTAAIRELRHVLQLTQGDASPEGVRAKALRLAEELAASGITPSGAPTPDSS